MAQPLTVALPPNLDLGAGYIIRVTALDAATGADVAGVNVSNITFEVDDLGHVDLGSGPFVALLRA
jgi:hypothetical protein